MDTKFGRIGKVAYVLFVIVMLATMGYTPRPAPISIFAAMPMGYLLLMGFEVRLLRFWRIMPLRPRIVVLARYIHYAICLLIGLVFIIATILILDRRNIASYNFTMLVLGFFLSQQGLANAIEYYFNSKRPVLSYTISLVFFAAPVSLIYLIFGAEAVNGIISDRIAGVAVMSQDVFSYPGRFAIFLGISFTIYVASYFFALRAYKKTDFQQLPDWWGVM